MKHSSVFQDWVVNKGNIKGRFVLFLFRIASRCVHVPFYLKIPALIYVSFYKILVEWVMGIEIPWRTSLGENARIFHGFGLVIHDRAVIGRDCVIRHSTTIGVSATAGDYSGEAPKIGDYVDIGSNVVLIGGIVIGNRVVIGAGSVVIKDVPSGSVVVGNPARIVSKMI